MRAAARYLVIWVFSALCPSGLAVGQDLKDAGPGVQSLKGVEPTQQIAYVRFLLRGKTLNLETSAEPGDAMLPTPVLIAQCTHAANGKDRLELMMNFGGVSDTSFHPPWKSRGRDDPFPPPVQKVYMVMEFLGYTRVKPVKRQWDILLEPFGEFRYTPPSGGARNLEEITFYLQYLKALPTLRITANTRAVQFETTPLLNAIHNEPLCRSSGV